MQNQVTITPRADGKSAELSGRLGPDIFELARELPGRRRWQDRTLVFELSRQNVEMIRERLPSAVWIDQTRINQLLDVQALERDARAAKRTLPREASAFHYKTIPREHQRQAFVLSKDRKAFGLFLEQGLGKTKVVLDNAAYLYSTGEIDTLLVIAPNGVHTQWLEEQVPIHLPDWVPRKGFVYYTKMNKTMQRQAEEVFAYQDGLRIFCVHVDAMATVKGVAFIERILHSSRTLWAIDESLSIKTPGAKRTRTAMRLRNSAPYRRILTGTPVGKGVEDLFTQLRWLDDDVHGFTSFYTFRNHYCKLAPVPGAPAGVVKIVGYKNLDELKDAMDAWTFRATADECLDLPERTYQTRYIEMTDEQRRVYSDLKEEFLAQLDDGSIVTADQAIVKLLRLQQILCGHVKDQDGALRRLPTERPGAVYEIAEQVGPKLVVWARFQHDIDLLAETFAKWNPVTWDGRTSIEGRQYAKRAFIDDPSCGPFIANPSAAGIGLDGLQHVAHTMAYYSNSFKAVDRWQSEARLFRDGQKGTVNVIDLVTPKTVDEYILKILRSRRDVADAALSVRGEI